MGYTPEEFKKLTNPFELAPPDDRKLVTKLFEKLLQQPGSTERALYRVLHKNGKHIWIESAMTNLLKDPNVGAVVINYRDISERKEFESQKDDFISIATHELKTPVTSIKAYAQVLQSRFAKEGNVQAVDMLIKMDAQLKKLTGLIGDLLDVTRVDGGKLQFHESFFDFNDLVNEIIAEMKLTTTKHRITQKLGATKTVYGDRDRVGQVLTNLLSNAIKYSPHGEKIIVTTAGDKKEMAVCVQDFGIGIVKDQQAKVFERFFRVGDAEDTFAGLGLGLFISSEIVKRHGGQIRVKSMPGKGSTFCFTLPVRKRAAQGGTALDTSASTGTPKIASGTWSVVSTGNVRAIAFAIGDPANGSALTNSSVSGAVTIPFACTISAYNLAIDAGTITVKFWKIATGTAIPTVSNVINTSGVSIASGTAIHSTTVSDFTTTTVSQNDIMIMAVTSVATAKVVTGVLQCSQ
jgi:PAS domain S-box-containing protein